MRSKAACFAAGVEASRRVVTPPIGTSIADALAITRSSATHHNRPVPSAKSLVDVDGEGRVKFAHHRQGEIAVVAIAVVEGEAGEAPRELARLQALMHLVQGDDVDVEVAKMRQHRPQELRLDLEMMIGLKLAVAAGADVVQHENDADTCEDWSQQVMRAGEVQRFQSGADDGVAKQFHRDAGLPGYLQGRN